MPDPLAALIDAYDPDAPLAEAATIPSAWYTDARMHDLERRGVFAESWQFVGRTEQLAEPGSYITAELVGEPIAVVRDKLGTLRAFHNVCRHHAAAVLTETHGRCEKLRCPYHGWTYELDGRLRAAPEFGDVRNFNAAENGLVPVSVDTWEHFVFVRIGTTGPSLAAQLGEMGPHLSALGVGELCFHSRKVYELACNWKVFVDNYLDGGYHVPHIHKALGSVLDYRGYTIENRATHCLQSSPIDLAGGEAQTAAVRGGEMAYYYWLYPNFMLNWYEGYLDLNAVLPIDADRCRVVFEFFFADEGADHEATQRDSIAVAHRVQQEDIDVCESVQRGLRSRAYDVGRLSVRREAGEHLFHRLLHADLSRAAADVD
jgi:choline monooxygenase